MKKKIILIGPVYPYKGGISHYTSLMFQALSKKYNVLMMSYKFQYPKFMYKKEQKDSSDNIFQVQGAYFSIHTANPLNWILTACQIRKEKPDCVIIQWWHPYFSPCYWTICKLIGNIKVLFICHNVFPHERFPLDRWLTKKTLSCGQYFVVHSAHDEKDLKSILKSAKVSRTVLPSHNMFKVRNITYQQGRAELGILEKERVLLFFGFVREYKGLKYLLKAMPEIVQKINNVKLLVVGDFGEDKNEYFELIKELHIGSNINIFEGYIPDAEVEKFFSAADIVVLPYESATQSGIVPIAYAFEKPVIVTNVGGLPDVVIHGKTGYVIPPRDPERLAQSVVDFFEKNMADTFREEIKQEASRYSWDRMVDVIDALLDGTTEI